MADSVQVGQLHVVASLAMKCCLGCWEFPQKRTTLEPGDMLHVMEHRWREVFGREFPWWLAIRNGEDVVWIRPEWFDDATDLL
jgi:hypothetical protein